MKRHLRWVEVAVALAMILIAASLVSIAFRPSGEPSARQVACLSNERRSATAVLLYVSDNDEHLPNAESWMTSTQLYLSSKDWKFLACPLVQEGIGTGFISALSKRRIVANAATLTMVFESQDTSLNAHGELQFPDPPRHYKMAVAFADGHSKSFTPVALEKARSSFADPALSAK